MKRVTKTTSASPGGNRREFLKKSGAVVLGAPFVLGVASAQTVKSAAAKPKNIVLIITDQQHLDTLSAWGNRHVHTPGLDQLSRRGMSFRMSYCANPVCSPSRSSMLTSRMSSETGVHTNSRAIHREIPNLGQWFRQESEYETVYAGKWHLPRSFTHFIPGFDVLTTGIGGQGNLCDTTISRACEGFLHNRSRDKGFMMVASFMQPHDICEWLRLNTLNPKQLRYPELVKKLPPLPDNFDFDKNEPDSVAQLRLRLDPFKDGWSKEQWRYYLWSYYRHIEMVDAEIDRVLRALDETGRSEETLVVFTSDHGEGCAHHQMVRKSHLYDQASRVPLIVSYPDHIPSNHSNPSHLVSGVDLLPTLCDYAGIPAPPKARGRSLRSILEGGLGQTNEFIVAEAKGNTGRMVRTEQYKYVAYRNNQVEQLFDMRADPGETRNLAPSGTFSDVVADHKKLLKSWESRLERSKNLSYTDTWWYSS